MSSTHSPTPWKFFMGLTFIADANGAILIANGSRTNKEFIVLAVNSHDALLEAAQAALTELDILLGAYEPGYDVRVELEAAIALTEGSKP